MSRRHMDLQQRLKARPFWIIIPYIISLVPFSYPIREGEIAGAGADVVNTIWAMWWFQQEWASTGWGGHSTLFNFPFGGQGAILSPLNALLWSIYEWCFGPAWASILNVVTCLYGTMLLMTCIAREYKWCHLTTGCVLLSFVCARYFIFTLGETGVVGVAIWPLLLCWYSALRYRAGPRRGWLGVIFICIALQGLENPYVAPVPPLIVLFVLWGYWKQLFTLLMCGLLGIVAIGSLYHGTSASAYQSLKPSYWVQLFGQYFPVVERTWARISPEELFWPQKVRWPIGGQDTIHQSGRGFLGYSVLFLGTLGCVFAQKRRWLLIFLFSLGVIFSLGSDFGGTASPFALFNSICSSWVRALTQPTRYMILAVLALAFLVGHAVDGLVRKKSTFLGILCWSTILIEGLWIGGLSLRLPTTELPRGKCMSALAYEEGAVLVWPWDGLDDEDFDATLYSRLFQMVHNRPGATIGTGSWPVVGEVFPGEVLRRLGWKKALTGEGTLDISRLAAWGYRWVVVDGRVSRTWRMRARDDVFGSGNFVDECNDFEIYQLPKVTLNPNPIHPFVRTKGIR